MNKYLPIVVNIFFAVYILSAFVFAGWVVVNAEKQNAGMESSVPALSVGTLVTMQRRLEGRIRVATSSAALDAGVVFGKSEPFGK